MIISEVKLDLTIDQPDLISREYNKRKKSIFIAYYLCLFMSGFGLHKFYLGKKAQAIKFISLYWAGLFVFSIGYLLLDIGQFIVGAFTFLLGMGMLVIFGIWWLVDIFSLYTQTKRANKLIKQGLINSISYE